MSAGDQVSDDRELAGRIASWRPRFELLGLAVALGSLSFTLGAVVAAFDTSVQPFGFSAWDRFKVVGSQTADPGVLGAGAFVVLLVVLLRVVFRWPDSTPSVVAGAAIVVAMTTVMWQVIARSVFLAAVMFEADGGWLGVHTGYHQTQAALAAAGTAMGAGALIGVGAVGLGLLRDRREHRPEPLDTAAGADLGERVEGAVGVHGSQVEEGA